MTVLCPQKDQFDSVTHTVKRSLVRTMKREILQASLTTSQSGFSTFESNHSSWSKQTQAIE